MEEKKTTNERGGIGLGWAGLLLQGVFGSMQSLVHGVFESLEGLTEALTRRYVRRILLLFLVLLGLVFLLMGFAKMLSTLYPFPGVGEALIGAFILVSVLSVHLFTRKE